jgi:hypothetical protein
MRRIWRRKWLLAAAALAMFLSVGAVAWAAGSDDGRTPGAPAGTQAAAGFVLAQAGSSEQSLATAARPGLGNKQAFKEKREQRIKRQEALMQLLREKMTPADQAAYDRLVQTAKDQRVTLQKAREDLASTVKDLRELAKKYIDAGSSAASTAPTGTSLQ